MGDTVCARRLTDVCNVATQKERKKNYSKKSLLMIVLCKEALAVL